MPLNFNSDFNGPKIDIVSREVPVAAIEKTGDILQDRYDKSYENYTKFQELARQTEQIADPLERDKVKEYISSLQPELKRIAEKGDFHNMRWQTLALANNAAANLGLFKDRASEIKKYRDLIATHEKLGDEQTKQFYQNKLNQSLQGTSYNPETKTFNFTPIQLPKIVEDYDTNKFLQSATQGWIANKYGSQATNMAFVQKGQKIPGINGVAPSSGVYNIKTGHEVAKVDFNEIYNNALKMSSGERGLQAMIERDVDVLSEGQEITPEQREALKDKVTRKYLYEPLTGWSNKSSFTQEEDIRNYDYDPIKSGAGSNKTPAQFTQRPSAIFKSQGGQSPFKVDNSGNIVVQTPQSKDPYSLAKIGLLDEKMIGSNEQIRQMKSGVENSTTYKRLLNFLTQSGKLSPTASKKEKNEAIVNYWNNQLADAESSIAVAEPGNEEANKYIAEINKSYFGTPTPDANTKGSSILNGQLAQAIFTNENGKKVSAQEVFKETSDKNVRINGWVNQIESPFEYGSHYMVAVDPKSGEQKHYLVEPDIDTKNSGAYFANRIYNSTRRADLKSSWVDGNGINYQATPLDGGERFTLYLNNDIKTPIILDKQDLQELSTLPSGQANMALIAYYNKLRTK